MFDRIWGPSLARKAPFFGGFAAEMAFYFALSLVPFLGVTVTLVAMILPLDISEQLVELLKSVVPAETKIQVDALFESAQSRTRGGWLTAGTLLAVWTTFRFMFACTHALSFLASADERNEIPVLWKRTVSALWLVLTWMFALVATSVFLLFALVVEQMLRQLSQEEFLLQFPMVSEFSIWLWTALRPVFLFAILFFAFFLTYRGIPGLVRSWRHAAQGAALASVGWVGLSYGFSWLVTRFWEQTLAEATLGSIVLFLLWAYMKAWVVLVAGCYLVRVRDHARATGETGTASNGRRKRSKAPGSAQASAP